jgi:alanyl-tRNA synthetase
MQDLQAVFSQIQKVKKEQREIKSAYKQALESSLEYKQVSEQLDQYKARKKQIEEVTKQEYAKELDKLDVLKRELDEQNTMLSDIALSKIMNGEQVEEIVDESNNTYEPILSVKFKKSGSVRLEETKKALDKEDAKNVGFVPNIMEINPSLDF